MPGLINQPAQQGPQLANQGQAMKESGASLAEAQSPAQGQPGDQATPEEQEAYDRVTSVATLMLHDEQVKPNILEMLQMGVDTPAESLAQTATMLFTLVDEKSNGKIPEDIIGISAIGILELVIELVEEEGVFTVDEKIQGAALQHLIVGMSELYGGDPAEAQERVQSMDPQELERIVAQQKQYVAAGRPASTQKMGV